MIIAVTRRYPDVILGSNDEADALVLAAMTADYYGCPIATVPAAHRAALYDREELASPHQEHTQCLTCHPPTPSTTRPKRSAR